ncbi:hypothetical protein [Eleftheria terrae]|uniref:hypothetical protein n=1 Tax=Eleftheria terrae TaxID=1597781 RepID=UPI00263A8C49|nr:hypothetical protein [Eleftheria terrae]WKB52619.1 hypothetical protein N7L95_22995 [Eleftheria terrae]
MNETQLISCRAGTVCLPPKPLIGREDGGHLIVNPPRPVWERSELTRTELMEWSFLVAATGQAMLEVLPQLQGGCLNYWEAGNWALNELAEPRGPKSVQDHRRVHLHIFGRSPRAQDPDWRWGESPKFPDYVDSASWSAKFTLLEDEECTALRRRILEILKDKYDVDATVNG